MLKNGGWCALLFVLVLVVPANALAQVARYAVVIGDNRGAPGELPLQYAEADADKLAGVLNTLGRVPADNLVRLQAPSTEEAQRALIDMNARIRSETGPGRDSLLLVYYSGHADAEALHLGAERLELSLLKGLVQGSSADFRLLIVDACRSGAITRRKGGRAIAPFPIQWDTELNGQGFAVLTSSAADEDAQESDALKGSFFTHYLVTGLRGAADRNDNSIVTLEEAYTYAYQRTLQASSKTLGGIQHPTFLFDLEGRGALPLSWLAGRDTDRSWLTLPAGRAYLILNRNDTGSVVAELGAEDRQRRLVLDPGQYFLRGRAQGYLLEGMVRLGAGEKLLVTEERLERVDYARLARKGGAGRNYAHGPRASYRLRSPLWPDSSSCQGTAFGYELDLPQLTLASELSFCRASFENPTLLATADDWGARLSASRVFDFSGVSVSLGLGAGTAWLHQRFETLGRAPARHSLAGVLGPELRLYRAIGGGFFAVGELTAALYVFRQTSSSGSATVARLTGTASAGLAMKF